MASVSDTEDGWATLYEISASSDDESSEEGLEQSTSDLQSRVDALLEKMDLLQLQIRLKNGSIQSLTGRLEVLETVDRKVAQLQPDVFAMQDAFQDTEIQNKVCKSSINVLADIVKSVEDNAKRLEQGNPDRIGIEGEIAEVHSRLDAAQIDKKGLQSQIRLNKGSVRSLERRLNALETNRVDALEASVERVERENHELFEREYDRISAAESDVRALGEATYDRYSQAIDRVTCLEANVERLEQDAKDRIDGGLAVAEFQSKVEAIEDDRKLLQSQIRLNKGSMVSLAGRVKGLESSVEHHREEKNRVDSLESDMEDLIQVTLQRVKRENKARMDNLELQNQALQDALGQAQRIIEGLHIGIQTALGQINTDLSGLKQRVEMLESSKRDGDSVYTITTSMQENRFRNLEARVDGLQSNGYPHPNNQYLNVPYGTAYFVPSYVNNSVRR
ncbi:hypothetical protein EYB26_003428 [Talaromyces marneffei]|uniref:uncharacterized protein n=1 Tax=Talaromyces marneffei TaxID=37727 RepID=UPI0012AA0C43|nr:uncharacterized protein EYB26_003428 [Talaromyces marneffei]QGA15768.1 hypothetical protein EYB26_003428 [Talaromyces marneffei]